MCLINVELKLIGVEVYEDESSETIVYFLQMNDFTAFLHLCLQRATQFKKKMSIILLLLMSVISNTSLGTFVKALELRPNPSECSNKRWLKPLNPPGPKTALASLPGQ